MQKVVLAYSGGLDTSCAIKWLKDRGFSVICFIADLGQAENFARIKARALKTGAAKVYVKDLKKEFVLDFVFPALKANALYEGKYLLATALGRPLIAKHLVEIAHKEQAKFIAHGCTGKGNDQVRLEVTAALLDKKLKVIAPLKIWELKTRNQEIEYARKHKIPIEVTKKKPYSIDKNLWGASIEAGVLEDPYKEPPADVYQMTKDIKDTSSKPLYLEINFKKGIPVGLNGKALNPINLIQRLNQLGGLHGIGRTDLIENRIVGIKSREIYEAPAGWILYLAHKELESMVLTQNEQQLKELIAMKYSQIVYSGFWYSHFKKSLDKFINKMQIKVNGTVRMKLYKGNCIVAGRISPNSLYREELATYGAKDKFDFKKAQRLIQGLIKKAKRGY